MRPNLELAEAAGLAVDNGVVVDARLLTDDPAISALGDCAAFPTPDGRMVRLESVQAAVDHARHIARRLAAGETAPYAAVPWFWSDQGDRKLQIAGLATGAERRVVAPSDAGKLVVLSLAGDRLVAVETVNAPAPHMATRRLLAGPPVTLAEIEAADFDLPRLAKERRRRTLIEMPARSRHWVITDLSVEKSSDADCPVTPRPPRSRAPRATGRWPRGAHTRRRTGFRAMSPAIGAIDPVLVGGEGLDHRAGMALRLFGDRLGKLFLNAACSSGGAASAWLGRGLWIVHSIARRASQPRCSATRRPSSAAMKAATFFAVQSPAVVGRPLQPFPKRREHFRGQHCRRGAVAAPTVAEARRPEGIVARQELLDPAQREGRVRRARAAARPARRCCRARPRASRRPRPARSRASTPPRSPG